MVNSTRHKDKPAGSGNLLALNLPALVQVGISAGVRPVSPPGAAAG